MTVVGDTFALEKGDGTAYEVTRGDNPTCSCPAFRYRHAGLPTAGCRHIVALRGVNLLPPVPDFPEPDPGPCECPQDDATLAMIALGILPIRGGAPEVRPHEEPAPAREEDVEAESMQPEPAIPLPTFLVALTVMGGIFWLLGWLSQVFPPMP